MDKFKTLYRIEIKTNEFVEYVVSVQKYDFKYEDYSGCYKVWKYGAYEVSPEFVDMVDFSNPKVSYVSSEENIKPMVYNMFSCLIEERKLLIKQAKYEIEDLEKSFNEYKEQQAEMERERMIAECRSYQNISIFG